MGKNKITRRRVKFALIAPGAKNVSLAGTFNGWNTEKHLMNKNKEDVWTKTVVIPPGTYEYKFLVGGEWLHDPENEHVNYNEHGTLNSVIIVD